MTTGECVAYSSLSADSMIKFAAWPTSWRPPDFHLNDLSEISHMDLPQMIALKYRPGISINTIIIIIIINTYKLITYPNRKSHYNSVIVYLVLLLSWHFTAAQ